MSNIYKYIVVLFARIQKENVMRGIESMIGYCWRVGRTANVWYQEV